MPRILIVDDSPDDAERLASLILKDHPDFNFTMAEDSLQATRKLKEEETDCVLLDYRLGYENGIDLLPELLNSGAKCPVIILTGQGSEKIAALAMKSGASDYLIKQEATGTDLRTAIEHAMQRAQMQKQIAAQEQELMRQGRLEALGQLSAGIAHDFNNMLATVKLGVEGVKRAPSSAKAAQKLEMISATVDRAAERTLGLLAFASKQVGRLSNQMCSSVIEEIDALTGDIISNTCSIEISPCTPDIAVYCDQALLQNALLNLIVNARDAIVDSNTAGFIRVNAQIDADPTLVKFSVSDNGVGIDPDILRRVADPYFTTKQENGGTGIGLSMVHGFASQCGSKLDIQSELGKGTKVSFCVPVGTVCPELTDEPSDLNTKSVASKDTSGTRHVLVVEDQVILAMMIKDDLQDAGFKVTTAIFAEDALRELSALNPNDAVVTDISLGGKMDGFDLAEVIRKKYPSIQIIGMSGFHEFNSSKRVEILDAMLTKPFPPETLVSALNALKKP